MRGKAIKQRDWQRNGQRKLMKPTQRYQSRSPARVIYLTCKALCLAQNPTLDSAFLFEQIELRETLDEIRQAGSLARAEAFIKTLAEKQSAEARAFNDHFKAAALTEATTCVYRMQFLSKLLLGAKALEEELLGY